MSEGFEYGNARVRARRADLFGRAQYEELVGLDVDRLLATLSDTAYRPDLVAATSRYHGMRLFDEALRTNLARNLRDLVMWYDGAAATLLTLIVGRWDVRNIRTILRGQFARAEPDEIRAALVPAGALTDDVLGELADQPGLRPVIELMLAWGVPSRQTARAVADALKEFESSANWQALERIMDLADAEQLRRALDDAEPEVARILRAEIDRINLLTAVRLHQAGSDGRPGDTAELAEHFLDGGAIPVTGLVEATQAPDSTAAAAILLEAPLETAWRPAIQQWSESANLVELGDALDEMLTRSAAGMFATADPLGPGVPLAFVWAKQNEVENLRTIGAALAAGVPPDLIEEELVIL